MNLGLAKALDRRLGGLLGGMLGAVDALAPARSETAGTVRRILISKFWGVGNWALLRPIVRDVRDRWPDAEVTIATFACNVPLVEDLAESLVLVRATSMARTVRDLTDGAARLRRTPPDLALDFEPFARSGALLARLGRATQRVGFGTGESGRDGLYTVRVPFRADAHASRSFRDLVEAAGVAHAPYVPGALGSDARGRRELEPLQGRSEPYVLVHPGSGDNFPGRRWSPAGFAAVGRTAREAGRGVFVTGSESERGVVEEVSGATGEGAVPLAGRLSLRGLIALLEGAEALVSNDTGPVHLASALAVPTLALYGPNTPVLYGPLANGSRSFYRALPCSPCLTAKSYRSSRCRVHTCMESISTGQVTMALREFLARKAPEPRGGYRS